MNKRLKKKAGNRYPLLKMAKRKQKKRKGYKCLDYALIPFTALDVQNLSKEGWGEEINWATHWFVRLHEESSPYFFEDRIRYGIYIYFATEKGAANINSPFYINFFKENDEAYVRSKFELLTSKMKDKQPTD